MPKLSHPEALPSVSDCYDLALNESTSSATPEVTSIVKELSTVTHLIPLSTSSASRSKTATFTSLSGTTTPMGQAGIIPSTSFTSQSGTFIMPSPPQSVTNPPLRRVRLHVALSHPPLLRVQIALSQPLHVPLLYI